MKLFSKYNRIILGVTILTFLAACIAYYFILNYFLNKQVDGDLLVEQREITTYVDQFHKLPENVLVKDQTITYRKVSLDNPTPIFKNIKADSANGSGGLRAIEFGVMVNGEWIHVVITKSLADKDGFFDLSLLIATIMVAFILFSFFVINRAVLNRLWEPFNQSLDKLQSFRLESETPAQFPKAGIKEFDALNRTLNHLTSTARFEYLSLKTFSENASHELQTPIAIIQSKLDVLIQDEDLTRKQGLILESVYDALQRLARLNSSLLLLARIENRQFEVLERINLKPRIETKISAFRELWTNSDINYDLHLEDSYIKINDELAHILLNNLFSNATKYTAAGGLIEIRLGHGALSISNIASGAQLHPEKIFQRFYKPNPAAEGTGMGLSLIRQICEVNNISVNYNFNNSTHQFHLHWAESLH